VADKKNFIFEDLEARKRGVTIVNDHFESDNKDKN
jgi:hypothetical protein